MTGAGCEFMIDRKMNRPAIRSIAEIGKNSIGITTAPGSAGDSTPRREIDGDRPLYASHLFKLLMVCRLLHILMGQMNNTNAAGPDPIASEFQSKREAGLNVPRIRPIPSATMAIRIIKKVRASWKGDICARIVIAAAGSVGRAHLQSGQ